MQKLYLFVRRGLSNTLRRAPWADRLIGDCLRRFENKMNLHDRWLPTDGQFTVHGLQLAYRAQDQGVALTIKMKGHYEPETEDVLRQHLRPGDTFVDLGAHIGYFTLLAAQLVGTGGKVYAFEPNPGTHQLLQHNITQNALDEIVTVVPSAVSNAEGFVRFHTATTDTVSARIGTDNDAHTHLVEVPTTSLDAFFATHAPGTLRLIKMDVEGAEIPALAGMQTILQRHPAVQLIIEFNLPHLHEQGYSPASFMDALTTYGLRQFQILKAGSGYETPLRLPDDLTKLERLGQRMTFNLLCST